MSLGRGTYVLFADGNRNDGSPMAGGVIKYPTRNALHVVEGGVYSIPVQSEMIDHWEYAALIEGLTIARRQGIGYLRAYMDRRSVVEQVEGRLWETRRPWKTKAASLVPLVDEVLELADGIDFRLSWIPAALNKEADALARGAHLPT
jgi:ribonuclease HI